jgi:hypothetical protein
MMFPEEKHIKIKGKREGRKEEGKGKGGKKKEKGKRKKEKGRRKRENFRIAPFPDVVHLHRQFQIDAALPSTCSKASDSFSVVLSG